MKYLLITGLLIISIIMLTVLGNSFFSVKKKRQQTPIVRQDEHMEAWQAPDSNDIATTEERNLIRYGRELILHTSKYFGQKGSIALLTNGMNCGNCHINAGAQPFGNSFFAVASTYPKYKERSGKTETIEYRINECMERSLDGLPLDSANIEMKAMVAYIKWIGSAVPKGVKPKGTGTEELSFLTRPADPGKGSRIYVDYCQGCHGRQGQGVLAPDSDHYIFPPLWGSHSYNVSAGMYRLSKLAGFIKDNMPLGATWQKPQLSAEQAWDVAAFINSQPHTVKFFSYDWPKISTKPVDYPFGPYSDGFSEKQHKYGPFGPIKMEKAKQEARR